MIKGFIAYTVPELTVGVEGYINNLKNDDQATEISTGDRGCVNCKGKRHFSFCACSTCK